ncbi:hypothetical protein BCV70DRAFT_125851 [Testicularia cyperi]|uniref:Uncharacterized protein n=1 Tax=Testicularia cyperi TaxID=1882483 RepID=A0A317XLI4_9BASI|nr:hypothetical protein BCV70DRAFT_125851 [Testicularia cyperi]
MSRAVPHHVDYVTGLDTHEYVLRITVSEHLSTHHQHRPLLYPLIFVSIPGHHLRSFPATTPAFRLIVSFQLLVCKAVTLSTL